MEKATSIAAGPIVAIYCVTGSNLVFRLLGRRASVLMMALVFCVQEKSSEARSDLAWVTFLRLMI